MKNLTFSKVPLSLAALALLAVFGLAGCGSGGGGSEGGGDSGGASSSTSTELSGVASKGPIVNGTITAFKIANGQKGNALASIHSDSAGNYKLNLGDYSGPVLIEVTGGSYKDEATGNTVALASTIRSAIANVIPNKSGSTVIKSASVTPVTEAAVQNAAAGVGGLTAANIQTANDIVQTHLGFDPVTTQPADANSLASATASTAAKAYGALLGTVSQYLKDNPSKSLENATSEFAIALKAGGSGIEGNALITAAGNNFGANANNQTGVSSMAALQTLTATLATIDDEDPVSQRTVAAALFKDDPSISGCGPDSVKEYNANPSTCSVKYNYNLSGMPGCFSGGSNYISNDYISDHIRDYQTNNTGVDWKTPGFLCTQTNIYASDKWSMNDGRVMDGTHNGIDFRHKTDQQPFYAISSGKLITGDKPNGTVNTIAVYDASNNLTVLYLHSDPSPRKGGKNGVPLQLGDDVSVGDYLGTQGNHKDMPYHVHVSVRAGRNEYAADLINSKGGYLPPVATLLTYLSAAPTDSPPPSTPTGLAASAASSSQINLSWSTSTDAIGVAGYKIYRGGTYLKSASTTTSSDTSLSASTQYCYTVSAYDTSNNESSQSSSACATTQATGTAPPAPTNLTATAGNGQATISWNEVSGATSYNIYWSPSSGVTKATGTKISNVISPYTHPGRTDGTTYYYVVTAVNSYGESMESSQVSATANGTGGVSYTW